MAPTNRVGAGFHAETWLGQNAAVVKSVGLILGPDADVWQAYGILNLPVNAHGSYLQLKAGKMATLLGVEVGEDVLNPNLGVGYQDIFLEPFTETGVELDAKVSPKWDAELRVTNGWDQVTDVNKSKTVTARLGLTPDDKTLIALTGYLGPEQPQNNHDNRTGVDLVASRKIISALTAQLQLDYGEEENAAAGRRPGRVVRGWGLAHVCLRADRHAGDSRRLHERSQRGSHVRGARLPGEYGNEGRERHRDGERQLLATRIAAAGDTVRSGVTPGIQWPPEPSIVRNWRVVHLLSALARPWTPLAERQSSDSRLALDNTRIRTRN